MKRRILGEEIIKAVKFPLMSQREFAFVVIDSSILTDKELSDMMKYYSNISATSLSISQVERLQINFLGAIDS